MPEYLTLSVYLVNYQYSDSVINIPDMKRIRETRQDNKNIPQNGTQLTVEERLQILANLIVDRLLEQKKQGLLKATQYGKSA